MSERFELMKKTYPGITELLTHPNMEGRTLFIFDTETTGLDVRKERIASLAILAMALPKEKEDGTMTEGGAVSAYSLVNPGMPIPFSATQIHGITDDMVKNAPTLHDSNDQHPRGAALRKTIHNAFNNFVVAGFNTDNYDVPLVSNVMNGLPVPHRLDVRSIYCSIHKTLKGKLVDVAHMMTEKYPDLNADFLRVEAEAHDARADVQMTALALEGMIREHGVNLIASFVLDQYGQRKKYEGMNREALAISAWADRESESTLAKNKLIELFNAGESLSCLNDVAKKLSMKEITISFAAQELLKQGRIPEEAFANSVTQDQLLGVMREMYHANPSSKAKPLYEWLRHHHDEIPLDYMQLRIAQDRAQERSSMIAHAITQRVDPYMIDLIAQQGFDASYVNHENKSLLSLGIEHGYFNFVAEIKRYAPDPDIQKDYRFTVDVHGNTPKDYAIKRGGVYLGIMSEDENADSTPPHELGV